MAEAQLRNGVLGQTGFVATARPYFNLSHSEDAALVAVCSLRHVGIDIERRREGMDIEMLVNQYFHPSEGSYPRTRFHRFPRG